jgi:hypothetical protein
VFLLLRHCFLTTCPPECATNCQSCVATGKGNCDNDQCIQGYIHKDDNSACMGECTPVAIFLYCYSMVHFMYSLCNQRQLPVLLVPKHLRCLQTWLHCQNWQISLCP